MDCAGKPQRQAVQISDGITPQPADRPSIPLICPPPTRSIVKTVSKPTLKITRHDDRQPPGDVSFEVWNPLTARYEPRDMLDCESVPALDWGARCRRSHKKVAYSQVLWQLAAGFGCPIGT